MKQEVDVLLSPSKVAELLGLSVETLSTWRATNRYALPYVKAGRLVRYRAADVQAFIDARLHGIPP